jgi:glycosyl transferase family 25
MFVPLTCHDPTSCGKTKKKKSKTLRTDAVPDTNDADFWDWSGLAEAVYCISLIEDNVRADAVRQQFHRVGLCSHVTFYRSTRDKSPHLKKPSERGCWESHRACCIDATARGASRALIFEDDIAPRHWLTPNAVRKLVRVVTATKTSISTPLPRDWNILNLTFTTIHGGYPVTPKWNIWRIKQDCTAAYVITADTMRLMCEEPFDRQPTPLGIDTFYRKKYRTFTVFPPLFVSGGFVTTVQSHNVHALQRNGFIAISWLYFVIVPILIVLIVLGGGVAGIYFGAKKTQPGSRVPPAQSLSSSSVTRAI